MPNQENLIHLDERPPEERKRIAAAGGRASGRAKLRKKAGRELVRAILSMKEQDGQIQEEIRKAGIADADITKEVAMHVRQIQKAIRKADTRAYHEIMKAAGYTEDEGVNINIASEEPPVIVFGDTSQEKTDGETGKE
jgi:hypothetical protein